jgi:hypothetical protein
MVKGKRAARRGASKTSARGTSKRKRSSRVVRAPAALSSPTNNPSDVSGDVLSDLPSDLAGDLTGNLAVEDQLIASSLSLHELFQQQTRQILERTDLEEQDKQHILVAMSCPCCGAGAMAFTAKLRR